MCCAVLCHSDGLDYPFLAKPKDDLRKDYRLMDFAGTTNALLARTPGDSFWLLVSKLGLQFRQGRVQHGCPMLSNEGRILQIYFKTCFQRHANPPFLYVCYTGARRRGLALRTYGVLPLTDDCGILQWVNNLVPFKAACEDIYIKEKMWKRHKTPMQIKVMYDNFAGMAAVCVREARVVVPVL